MGFQVAATGTPLLNLKDELVYESSIVSPGTPLPLGPYSINQIAYEAVFQAYTAAATASPVEVSLAWSDVVTGVLTGYQTFIFYAGILTAPHQIEGHGPSSGDQLTVTITALANPVTIAYALFQSSRPYLKHLWRTSNQPFLEPPSIPGFTYAPNDTPSNIIANIQQAITANNNEGWILPLYTGRVQFNGRTSDATAGNGEWRIAVPAEAFFTSVINWVQSSGQSGFAPFGSISATAEILLPRVQSQFVMFNLNASNTETLNGVLIAADE